MARQTELYLYANTSVPTNVTFTSADTTTLKTVVTASANDTDVFSISVATTDTAAKEMALWLYDGVTAFLLTTVTIPLSSGFTGTAMPINLLNTTNVPGMLFNAVGKAYYPLSVGCSLRVGFVTAMTAAKTAYVTACGKDF